MSMKNQSDAFNFKMKPLFNFIENISLQLDHQKSAEQNNDNNKSRRDQEKNDFKGTDSASTGKEELPLPSNVSCLNE